MFRSSRKFFAGINRTQFAFKPDFRETFVRGTQREYSSKPLEHSIVKRILVFKR